MSIIRVLNIIFIIALLFLLRADSMGAVDSDFPCTPALRSHMYRP